MGPVLLKGSRGSTGEAGPGRGREGSPAQKPRSARGRACRTRNRTNKARTRLTWATCPRPTPRVRFPRTCAEAEAGTAGKREANIALGVPEPKVETKPVSTNELMVSRERPAQVCRQGSGCLHVPRPGALEDRGSLGGGKHAAFWCRRGGQNTPRVPHPRVVKEEGKSPGSWSGGRACGRASEKRCLTCWGLPGCFGAVPAL